MKRNMPLLIVFIALVAHASVAQQSKTPESALYTFDYHGDIWTGTLASVDHEKDGITLQYEHKGTSESFSAVLSTLLRSWIRMVGQPKRI